MSEYTEKMVFESVLLSDTHISEEDPYVVKGVRVLAKETKNLGTYTETAIASTPDWFEGATVMMNHDRIKPQDRNYENRIGWLSNVVAAENNTVCKADLNILPVHPYAKVVLWDAKNKSSGVGLSIAATVIEDKKHNVHGFKKIHSIDWVLNPACAKNAFESVEENNETLNLLTELKTNLKQLSEKYEEVQELNEKLRHEVEEIKKPKPVAITPVVSNSQDKFSMNDWINNIRTRNKI